jgi:integrase/recombinase XerC
VQLQEKGGKQHAMPCHYALAEMLRAYIDSAGIADDRKGWLFRTSTGHKAMALADTPMSQADAWRMIRRRAAAAGIHAPIGNPRFAQQASQPISAMAARSNMRNPWPSPRTTRLYDRTKAGLLRTKSRG